MVIDELMGDPARRAALEAAAAERAKERFSWDRCAERYLAIAETIVKPGVGGRSDSLRDHDDRPKGAA